jgi:hypothetical protein
MTGAEEFQLVIKAKQSLPETSFSIHAFQRFELAINIG